MPNNIYSVELKLETIEYVKQGHSVNESADKYLISKSQINRWLAVYKEHGLEGLDRKTHSYSAEFKQQVIEDMRENGLSFRQTAVKYNIGCHISIQKWERVYMETGVDGLRIENRGKACTEANALKGKRKKHIEKDLDVIAEVQRLRMENEYLKKLYALVRIKEK